MLTNNETIYPTWHPPRLVVKFDKYRHNDRICVLLSSKNNTPYGVLSVNVPEIPLEDNQFIVKGYSENTGLDNVNLYGGLFRDTGSVIRLGYNICQIWQVVDPNNFRES